MIPSQQNKGAKRRKRLVLILVLCFLSWAGLTAWDQMAAMNVKLDKLALLEAELAESHELNAVLKHEVVRLHDPEYIEQRVRKDFQMTKEGETMFITSKAE